MSKILLDRLHHQQNQNATAASLLAVNYKHSLPTADRRRASLGHLSDSSPIRWHAAVAADPAHSCCQPVPLPSENRCGTPAGAVKMPAKRCAEVGWRPNSALINVKSRRDGGGQICGTQCNSRSKTIAGGRHSICYQPLSGTDNKNSNLEEPAAEQWRTKCHNSQPNSRKTSSSRPLISNDRCGTTGSNGTPTISATTLGQRHSQPTLSARLARALPAVLLPAISALRCSAANIRHSAANAVDRNSCGGGGVRQNSLHSPPHQLHKKRFQPIPAGPPTAMSGSIGLLRKTSAGPSFYTASSPSSTNGGSTFNYQQQQQHRDVVTANLKHAGRATVKSRTTSSSFSGSSESMLNSGRNDHDTRHAQESDIDPVYLALKEATEKYGTKAASKNRRFSQQHVVIGGGCCDSATTPSSVSPRNLSQASLLDSGTFSGSGEVCGGAGGYNNGSGSSRRLFVTTTVSGGGSSPQLQAGHLSSTPSSIAESRGHIKLTQKMKSFSLDYAEPPAAGMKPLRSARGAAALTATRRHADSLDLCAAGGWKQRSSTSPSSAQFFARRTPRRLPTVPDDHLQQQQQLHLANNTAVVTAAALLPSAIQNSIEIPRILHIVTHEYIGGAECALRPGERLVVVDNGDPDWKHGFKLNDDRSEQLLLTFPSTCIAAYKTAEEQPMRLTQTCNLVDQKMRLYRDQVVFVQPNSLDEHGRVTVRNEHDKCVKCPLQCLILA